MSNFPEIERKLNFADFLISRGESESYSSAAFKHAFEATNLLLVELTDLDENASKSPQMIKQTLKRFNDSKAAEFSKFCIEMLQLSGKPELPKLEVESAIRRARNFMLWVQDQTVSRTPKPF